MKNLMKIRNVEKVEVLKLKNIILYYKLKISNKTFLYSFSFSFSLRVRLNDNDVLKTVFANRRQCCEKCPCSQGSAKTAKKKSALFMPGQ